MMNEVFLIGLTAVLLFAVVLIMVSSKTMTWRRKGSRGTTMQKPSDDEKR